MCLLFAERPPTPFEAAVAKRLQRAFAEYMGPRLVDYVTKKKLVFGRAIRIVNEGD